MKKPTLFACVSVLLALSLNGGHAGNGENLVLSSVSREIDLTTVLVQQKVTMVVENQGDSAVSQFTYTVDPSMGSKASYVGAKVGVSN